MHQVTLDDAAARLDPIRVQAARILVAGVADAIDRIVRAVTDGDVVPWSSECGAAGEWRMVTRTLSQVRL